MYGQENLDLSERSRLYEPGVFDGTLSAVREDTTKTGKEVLVFSFQAEDGRVFDHSEFPVDNGDSTKMKNQMQRIGVIMSRFVDEAKIKNMQGVTDWPSYRRFVINTLGNSFKNVPIQFKLVTNTFNEDNPKVTFPLYKGGMVLKSSDRELKLSKKEEEDVIVYKKLIAKKLQGEEGAANLPPVSQQMGYGSETEGNTADDNSELY